MILEIKNLTKAYIKDVKALDDVSCVLTPGIYGLLGPNGAGKSTLINLLTDNLKPTSGEILFEGKNIEELGNEYRKQLGYMPQQQTVYDGFTLEKFLYYIATLKGLSKSEAKEQIPEVIKRVNLEADKQKKLGNYSGGMKQRSLIAQSLLGNPKIIILDEPTAGLDPKERIRIRNLISEISRDKIVVIATHVVTDVEFVAKSIILIKKGKIIGADVPSKLCKAIQGTVFEIRCDNDEWKEIADKYIVSNMSIDGEEVVMRVISKTEPSEKCTEIKPTLEEVYLSYFEEERINEANQC